jgi:membrane protein DedA with SNARE-associated domain
MAELLEQLAHFSERVIEQLGYPGIALVMLLETVFPPLPSEVIMPFAGFLVSRGRLDGVGAVAAGTLGAVLGALMLYYAGRWAEDHVIVGFVRRYGRWLTLSEQDLLNALKIFDRHGDAIVFLGRLLPGVRSLISVPAGMDHMRLGRFLVFTTLGSALWNAALAYAGYWLGDRWETILELVERYEEVVFVGLGLPALAALGAHLWHWRRTRSKPTDAPPEA